jgi:sterol desaturase/sphingolipid hydroxylase (fatty acid hydroxylase superfamily)
MGLNGPLFYYFAPFFVAMIALEIWIGRKRGLTLYTGRETFASIGVQIGQRVIGYFNFGAIALVWTYSYDHRLYTIDFSNWWAFPALFLGVEFFYYWFHRLSHEVRWLWATHAVHHSVEELNILSSYRLGWTGQLSMGGVIYAPLMLLGFSPYAVATMIAFNLFYQSWLHTVLIGKLPLVEGWLNTPSSHRVHHARNADYLDRNHGGVTLIFDRLFGTYVEEREDTPCDFGLVTPVGSTNPFVLAFHEWGRLIKDLARSHPKHWLALAFGPPGWAPNGAGRTSADLRAAYRLSRKPAPSDYAHEEGITARA